MFPDWDMRIFDLNEEAEALPLAFRQTLSALLEANQVISQYAAQYSSNARAGSEPDPDQTATAAAHGGQPDG